MPEFQFRRLNSSGIIAVASHFILEPGSDRDAYAQWLAALTEANPEQVYALVAMALSDRVDVPHQVAAVMVTWAEYRKPAHCWIEQAYANPKFHGTDISERMMLKVCMWAEGMGLDQFRGMTQRDIDAIYRKWEFEPYATIVCRSIPDMVASAAKGLSGHGRWNQHGNQLDANPGAGAGGTQPVVDLQQPDRPTDAAVSGTVGGSPESGVQPGTAVGEHAGEQPLPVGGVGVDQQPVVGEICIQSGPGDNGSLVQQRGSSASPTELQSIDRAADQQRVRGNGRDVQQHEGQRDAAALSTMQTGTEAQLAQGQFQNQGLAAQLAEQAQANQVTGVGLANQQALLPYGQAQAISSALQPIQQQAQAQDQAAYASWLQAQPQNNPYYQLALSYMGIPQESLSQNPNYAMQVAGQAAGLGGSTSAALLGQTGVFGALAPTAAAAIPATTAAVDTGAAASAAAPALYGAGTEALSALLSIL